MWLTYKKIPHKLPLTACEVANVKLTNRLYHIGGRRMDKDLLVAIVCGGLANIFVLVALKKIYNNMVGVISRFLIFVLLEAFLVFFVLNGMLFLATLFLVLMVLYLIGLGFRSRRNGNSSFSYEEVLSMSEEEEATQAKVAMEELMKNKTTTIKCPNCNNADLNFMGNDRKGFSAGKAVAGTVLTGGVGALAGFAGKKGDDQWHCKDCGQTFTTKK